MSGNGKGSSRRGQDPESRKAYEAGWDSIFGKTERVKNTKRVHMKQTRLKPYPDSCCYQCGIAASRGKMRGECATWGPGCCFVCGRVCDVTETRDFCYPTFPGHETRADAINRWMRDAAKEIRK